MAVRISGVTIPDQKQVWVALTYVYGIGPKTADNILETAKVERTTRVKNLTDAEVAELNQLIAPSSKTEEASLPNNKSKFTGKRNYGERNR